MLPPINSNHGEQTLNSFSSSQAGNYIFALTAIVTLGGIFILLASYEILPNGPNVVSDMGMAGESLGYFLVTAGGIPFFVFCAMKLAIKSPEEVERDRERDNLQRSFQNKTEDLRTLNRGLQSARSDLDKLEALRASLYDTPKRFYDGKEFGDALGLDYSFKAASLELDFKKIDEAFKHAELDEDGHLQTLLADAIEKSCDLYEKGRYKITPVDPSANAVAAVRHETNRIAEKMNQDIEDIMIQLSERLAKVYPHLDAPPPQLADPTSDALTLLLELWKALLESAQD